MTDGYDTSKPIHIGRFTIRDFHGKNRWLSVPEILIYSSNIGTAKMAVDVGGKIQQTYLGKLGLLGPAAVELPEIGNPLKPAVWRDINTMTIGYGHGIAVSPLQLAAAVGAVVDGGIFYPPTLIRRGPDALLHGERVFSAGTSRQMRSLMHDVVTKGTGENAKVAEYRVGGKTGTAEKLKAGAYQRGSLISSFVAAFPINRPRYVVLVLIDEPKGNKKTFGYATAGWVAAPAAGRIMRRVGAMMGLAPDPSFKPATPANPLLVKAAHDQRRAREQALAPD
jgi:cell division protein FtsI (penicillin-binding protein 3)